MTYFYTGSGLLRSARMPLSEPFPVPPSEDADQMEWLAGLWQVPLVASAIRAASPDLTRAIEGVLVADRPSLAAVQRVSHAALHYALRAWYRPTPFGLFAATGPLIVGETCIVPAEESETVVARADARWLTAVVEVLHADPDVLAQLTVVADPTRQISHGHVLVPYRPGVVGPEQVTAPRTVVLSELLAMTARPVPVAQVAAQLLQAYPDVPRDKVLRLISTALRNGLVHSDLRPSNLVGFPLTHVRAALEREPVRHQNPATAELIEQLIEVDDLLAGIHQSSSPPREVSIAHAYARMTELADTGMPPVMLDVRYHEPVTVPHQLAQDVGQALSVMTRTSAHPQGPPAWKDYRTRFLEKYSLGLLVPVRDVIDPVIGLGYPAGFLGSPWVAHDQALTARDTYLLGRAQHLMAAGSDELALTDQDLAALDHHAQGQTWPSTEVTVALQAESTRAVEAGQYDLVIEGLGSAAGALTGRFLALGSQNEREQAIAAHRAVPTLGEGAVRVQLCSPPLRWKAQNVARTIQLVPDVLALGEHAGQATMWLDEIAVGAAPDQLYLVHVPSGRRIEPFMPHAVDLKDATDPLARFLVELPRSHVPVLNPFDWGAAFALPYLPRVRAGRVVLRPARWQLTAAALEGTDDPAQAIQQWRQRWRVPPIVLAGETDRRLRLDLEHPAFRRELATLVRQRSTLHIQEAPPDAAHGWLGRVGQVTLQFAARQTHPAHRSRRPRPVIRQDSDARRPGAARTVLLRVDTGVSRPRDVFTAGLSDLLDDCAQVTRWWYTRYRDPRQHLRIRITLEQPHEFGRVAALIATWVARAHRNRLVDDVSWHTDRPETGRYGSGTTLIAAEAFFAADSRAALAQDTPEHNPHEREALLMASLLHITHHLLGGYLPAVRLWDEGGPRGSARVFDRTTRALALRLCPGDRDPDFGGLAGASDLARTWRSRAHALKSYRTALLRTDWPPVQVLPALAHLHHVRAYGLDSSHENDTQQYVRELAHSLLARAGNAAPA